jgi:excisionase family DNA binding protein
MPDEVYTTGQAAKLLGVHLNTVLKWCRLGRITAYRTSPIGHWRITRKTLEEYAQANNIPLKTSNE